MLYQPDSEAQLLEDYPGLLPVWREGLRSFMVVPLISNNEVIGVLWFGSRTESAYGHRELAVAERVSAQIAGAVGRMHNCMSRFEGSSPRSSGASSSFRTIGEVGRQLTSIRDPDELLAGIGKIGTTALGYETTALGIIEDDVLVFSPEANPHLSAPVRRSLGNGNEPQGITGLVAATGRPTIVHDVLSRTTLRTGGRDSLRPFVGNCTSVSRWSRVGGAPLTEPEPERLR